MSFSVALPVSKKVPSRDSMSSIRSPSGVMVISICFLSLTRAGLLVICCSRRAFRSRRSLRERATASPAPRAIGADRSRASPRIVEISRDGLAHVVAGIHKPEHNEERHHCGYEIRVGDLPCTAMMRSVSRALAYDNDGALRDGLRGHAAFPSPPSAGAAGTLPRHTCSTSAKLGRTCSGMARRPISIAICGALPLMAASISTRSM